MSTTNMLEGPNVKTGSYAERQAKKLERQTILCLQCSEEQHRQVYHSVKKSSEWTVEKNDPAKS